ncbi:MAG: hypothetical protein ABEJ95_03000 [Candidatus Nanohalobium sp.]
MKKALVLLVLLTPSLAGAVTETELQQFKQSYNQQTEQVPSFVGEIVGGEKISFKMEVNGENQTLGVAFEGVKISNITRKEFDKPTLKVWTRQETVTAVINSENSYATLQQKLDEKKIQYKATNMETGLKVMIFDTLRNLADMIGLNL